jgi:hypothetical protein
MKEIQKRQCLRVNRRKSNDVEVDETFQTSQIKYVSTDLAQHKEEMPKTQNSAYKVKIFSDPRPITNNIICYNCGSDTGIHQVLNILIPPNGLKCPHCGAVVVNSIEITC